MSPSEPLALLGALVDSAAWPSLQVGLHGAFFLTGFFLLWRVRALLPAAPLRHLGRPKRSLTAALVVLVILFGAALIHQASWQLTGLFRPQFVSFMQSHDRRQFNPAHRIRRGRILDHQGVVLADSRMQGGEVVRFYPFGPSFAHVVGYSHPLYGAAGMEGLATVRLNGTSPRDPGDWGELGRHLVTGDPVPRGRDLALTLDARLQLLAVELLAGRPGAVVMLRPHDGAVRVLASTPAYDPNRVTGELFRSPGPSSPLLNRATQGLYPPGSTFKVVIAAEALEQGFRGKLHCPADGFTTSPRYRKIRDQAFYSARESGRPWRGYGDLSLSDALAVSSNVFFAQIGVRNGHESFRRAMERFRFDRPVSLYEGDSGRWQMVTGRVPEIRDSDRYGLAQAAIGQGAMLTTPAQMALVTAAVANGGLAMKPRIDADEAPRALGRFLSEGNAKELARMMRRAVSDGTGRSIETAGLPIAGKTGTAQNPRGGAHSWFIGFAPSDRPALAVAVLVEHAGFGSAAAAPVARDLLVKANELGLLR